MLAGRKQSVKIDNFEIEIVKWKLKELWPLWPGGSGVAVSERGSTWPPAIDITEELSQHFWRPLRQ